MKYLMLIKHTEDYRNQEIPAGLHEAMGAFVEENLKSGVLKDTAGLKPTSDAFKVRQQARKLTTIDGPFTESKEVVGGYAMIEVASREQALAMARGFMQIHLTHWPAFEGECEVRPLEDM